MHSRRLLILMIAAVVAAIAGWIWIRGFGTPDRVVTTPPAAGSDSEDAGAPPPPAPAPVTLKGRIP